MEVVGVLLERRQLRWSEGSGGCVTTEKRPEGQMEVVGVLLERSPEGQMEVVGVLPRKEDHRSRSVARWTRWWCRETVNTGPSDPRTQGPTF